MIRVGAVGNCPHTRASSGIVTVPHPLIVELADCVYDGQEWLVILLGKRDTSGMRIEVSRFYIPEQYRDGTSCELVAEDEVVADKVGVLHSHHNMGAFFSGIDDMKLNRRFPLSVVISLRARGRRMRDDEKMLGFAYEATGTRVLPCGSLGRIPFVILPDPVPDGWPGLKAATDTRDDAYLGDCRSYHVIDRGGSVYAEHVAACGLTAMAPRLALFGKGGEDLLNTIRSQTKPRPSGHDNQMKGWKYKKSHQDYGLRDIDEAMRLAQEWGINIGEESWGWY